MDGEPQIENVDIINKDLACHCKKKLSTAMRNKAIFIDREAVEIICFVASVCHTVCQCGLLCLNCLTYDQKDLPLQVQSLCLCM